MINYLFNFAYLILYLPFQFYDLVTIAFEQLFLSFNTDKIMNKKFKIFIPLIFFCLLFPAVYAQEGKTNWGKLHGGVDLNTGIYKKDNNQPHADSVGINTYLNLNYEIKKFNIGVQYELFEPPMRGYPEKLKGHNLTQYFASFATDNFAITLGSFYEQLGSGLMFRSYEERALGINTSLRGVNVRYSPANWASFKVFGGQPRRYLEYADALYVGTDGDFNITKMWNAAGEYSWSVGGAWLLRYNTKTFEKSADSSYTHLYSIRTCFNNEHLNINAEYTSKGLSQTNTPKGYVAQRGDAFLVNVDLNWNGFAISNVFRRIEHMDFRVDGKPESAYISMNYIPALTKQHKYTLPSLYPHLANAEGEIGGQSDVFWEINPSWIGKYPLKLSLNASWYRSLGENTQQTMPFWGKEGTDLFREISIELEKKLSGNVKTNIAFYLQEKHEDTQKTSFISVCDLLCKINRKISVRAEFQHMNTDMKDKSWIYSMLEVGVAPNWMFFVSDLYNYGAETNKEHFSNGGISFSYKSLRSAVSYGKTRAGIQCVGGICRIIPEYTGANISISYVF